MKERQAWCCLQVKLCDPCLSALCVPWCEKALYKYSSFPFDEAVVDVVARRQMKTSFGGSGNDIAQSRVIEHHLRDNPIYARSTAAHEPAASQLEHCNSLHHQQHHQHLRHHPGSAAAAAAHSYEKLDHVIINPTSSSAINPAYNLLTVATPTAAVTSPDVVNTMGYLVASPAACDQLARPIIIWAAPRSRDASNMAELSVATDQHGARQCCCATTSASGLPSTATTSGGGYMECDARTRNNGEESRDRHHVTGGAESRDAGARHDNHHWLPRDQNAGHRRGRSAVAGPYTSMSHRHDRLNDWNISAL